MIVYLVQKCLLRLFVLLACFTSIGQAQYDTDGNGYPEVISLYRDEHNRLIWSLTDLSQGVEPPTSEITFGGAQEYPVPGYYLAEDRAHLAVLREVDDRYELELLSGERRSFGAIRPDRFPVTVLAGRLDFNEYTDIAIIKQATPKHFVWNVYYNPFQSDKRKRRRFGSGDGQPFLAHSIRNRRQLIAGYLPMRGQRRARIRFYHPRRVVRFERTEPNLVDFSEMPLSLESGYYFNSHHFSSRGRYIGELAEPGSSTESTLVILPGRYWPGQNAPEINIRQLPNSLTAAFSVCETHQGNNQAVKFACGLLQEEALNAKNRDNRQRGKNPTDGTGSNTDTDFSPLPAKPTATPTPIPTKQPTVTLVPTATATSIPTVVTPAATPTTIYTPTATNTSTPTRTPTSTSTQTPTPTVTPTSTPTPLPFVSVWNTALSCDTCSGSRTLVLPLESDGSYNFTVDWGDGTSDQINQFDQVETTHTYPEPGVYTVTINGSIRGFRFNNLGDKAKIVDIANWGVLRLGNNGSYFYGCNNLNSSATDSLDLSETTDLLYMFRGASLFNGDLSNWDTSKVTSMRALFWEASSFNGDISRWNTSNVTHMGWMFWKATNFAGDISAWDTSKVTNMSHMFYLATNFNSDISSWDVSSVTDMSVMFFYASSFNGDISSWNVSKVQNMAYLFLAASKFNSDLSNWNTSSVTNMQSVFYQATSFTGDISSWDTSKVTTMNRMFYQANGFNRDISSWDTSNVTDMERMFYANTKFNQDLSSWCVSKIPSKPSLFDTGASAWTNNPAWRPQSGSCP